MDNRGYKPKNDAFTREIRSNKSRIHPTDDENDAISLQSIDQNSSTNTVSSLKQNDNERRFTVFLCACIVTNIIIVIIFLLF
jgi:hypothetical protein